MLKGYEIRVETLMTKDVVSHRAATLRAALMPIHRFNTQSTWASRRNEPGIADFTFANPHEMPLSAVVNAFQQWSSPLTKDWFSYKAGEESSRSVVAESLRRRHGVQFEAADIAMTNGGFAALSVGLKAVSDPGDEAIINLPSWPYYEALTREAGLNPRTISARQECFGLDLEAIEQAISPRTRLVIVNSPNNPSGRIYSRKTLRMLAELLLETTRRYGRTVYILSDEPYSRITFDGRQSVSPAEVYSNTLVAYSYSKILLAPGQRLGYLAVHPSMPGRDIVRANVEAIQVAAGWTYPSALMQHAITDLEAAAIDLGNLQRKRDFLVSSLRGMGYQITVPEGTFYVLVRSPLDDDEIFANLLAERDIFVLPGTMFGCRGHIRLSMTASMDAIERSLAGFGAAVASVRSMHVAPR